MVNRNPASETLLLPYPPVAESLGGKGSRNDLVGDLARSVAVVVAESV